MSLSSPSVTISLRLVLPETELDRLLPDDAVAAEAAARGIEALIIGHLRARDAATQPNRYGLPKSHYWADASGDVESVVSGSQATVEIVKEGVALHYYGGTVRPKKKALAIPIHPSVAGVWPSEYGRELFVVWPKGKSSGLLVGADLGDEGNLGRALYRLVYKATIPADPTVLPDDEELGRAAADAVGEALR